MASIWLVMVGRHVTRWKWVGRYKRAIGQRHKGIGMGGRTVTG